MRIAPMKALVLTGSRADRNCQEMVHEALLNAGHASWLTPTDGGSLIAALKKKPDVAVVAGDRIEVLCATVALSADRIPICHISGGDVTEGSADDRYRDAITALACIHCVETQEAWNRLIGQSEKWWGRKRIFETDYISLTGNPALDRIRQTAILSVEYLSIHYNIDVTKPMLLVCVHPNTVGPDALADFHAVFSAVTKLDMQCVWIGANADAGGDHINAAAQQWCKDNGRYFFNSVSPEVYYSLMTHCSVMVGNSSAMLCEAPILNLPCLLFGHRQDGRPLPANVLRYMDQALPIDSFNWAFRYDRSKPVVNPYGDGHSAPRVVKVLEDNAWRWTKTTS